MKNDEEVSIHVARAYGSHSAASTTTLMMLEAFDEVWVQSVGSNSLFGRDSDSEGPRNVFSGFLYAEL